MEGRQRLCEAMPGWPGASETGRTLLIGVLVGEGIGGEVIPATLELLDALGSRSGRRFDLRMGGAIGKEAQKSSGKCLTDEVIAFCEEIFREGGAVLCGPGGGRFVYDLRAYFDLFCKFTPLRPAPALCDAGVLRPEHLSGIDIVAVRENSSGLYFGEWGTETDSGSTTAFHRTTYSGRDVERILEVACRLAARRRRRLCVTVKPSGVPAISSLWEEHAERLSRTHAIDTRILEIDNAVYQIIANPRDFDVIVSPNMFGDVLADCGALLLGSRGMSYSGNFGHGGRAVYQTGHGAAHDIAGTDNANPVGQFLSLAMLLRESFGWHNGADMIVHAIETTLASGCRTRDLAAPGAHVVGTRELTRRVIDAVSAHSASIVG